MNKKFPVQFPGFPAQTALEIDTSTDADVQEAILSNTAFPDRDLVLGRIGVDFAGKSDVAVRTALGEVTFAAGAKARLALGVFDRAEDVAEALALNGGEEPGLGWENRPPGRFAVLVAAYSVEAAADGKHPLGAVGTATFGVEASRQSTFAIVSRFDRTTGAADVLQTFAAGWTFPGSITDPGDLPPGTAVLVEVDGELGLKLGAQLGYDFSFVREIAAGGLSGDLGLKVAAKLSAEVGFATAGRFLICVERPEARSTLRLRLFKLTKKGWSFALNLTVGARFVTPPLPNTADEFVQMVFGVQGQQVMADLRQLEQWTDPAKDTAGLVAGLATEKALELIEHATGIAPATAFAQARGKFLASLKAWQELPAGVSAWIWGELAARVDPAERDRRIDEIKAVVAALASADDDKIEQLIGDAIRQAGYQGTPLGRLLISLGTDGVLELLERVPEIRTAVRNLQVLLSGGFLPKVQAWLTDALDLQPLLTAATEHDWNSLHGLVVGRLAEFFGERLPFDRADEVRGAINAVIGRRQELYEAVRKALARQYEAEFAHTYQRTTARTALLDATFDFEHQPAREAFLGIVRQGGWEQLFLAPIRGVAVGLGVLTHGISRKSTLQLTLPMIKADRRTIGESLARLEITSDGAELVGSYTLNATDERRAAGRFESRLSLAAEYPAGANGDGLRRHGPTRSRWTYVYRHASRRASFAQLRALLGPIEQAYFTANFRDAAGSFDTWLIDFDRQVESVLHNGSNDFGDVLISFELTLPGALLASWFQPRDQTAALQAGCAASKAIQFKLRELLFHSYLQDPRSLDTRGAALDALVLYASLPPVNAIAVEGDSLVSSTRDCYWDWADVNLAEKLAHAAPTAANLRQNLETIRRLLEAQNRPADAGRFAGNQVDRMYGRALGTGTYQNSHLYNLLFVESRMVATTADAIRQLAQFTASHRSSPAAALGALAGFGNLMTQAFHRLRSVYLPASVQTIGSVIFCEVTRAINRSVLPASPGNALLALTVLKERGEFKLEDFLTGRLPDPARDVAAEQRLIQEVE